MTCKRTLHTYKLSATNLLCKWPEVRVKLECCENVQHRHLLDIPKQSEIDKVKNYNLKPKMHKPCQENDSMDTIWIANQDFDV